LKTKSFREHADEQLAHVTMTEGMKHRVRQRIKYKEKRFSLPRRTLLRLVLITLLSLATLTAFAFSRGMDLYQLMGTILPHFATVRPEAGDLLQKDLVSYSFPHVDVAVREAAYDGRYLRVAYSVRDRAATAPLDTPGTSLTSDRPDIYQFEAAMKDGVWWATMDFALVEGHNVNPLGMSFSIAGENNGEAISWVQFDVKGLDLPDPFTVHLPFRGYDTPKELEFQMTKAGMQDIFYLQPPPDKRIGNHLVRVHEVLVTPIRTYVSLHLVFDPGTSVEECWRVTNLWMGNGTLARPDGSDPQRWADTASGPYHNMDWVRIDLPGDQFDYEDRIPNPDKPVTMQVLPEFTPMSPYPEAFRLGFDEDNFILIPFIKAEK